MYIYIYTCDYVCVCACVCVCVYVCIYIHWKYLKVLYIVFVSSHLHGVALFWTNGTHPMNPHDVKFSITVLFLKHIFNWGSGHYYFETRPPSFIIIHCFILQSQFRNHSQRILEMSSVSVTKISRARNARWRTPSYCMSVRECSRTRFRLGRSSWLGITSEAAGVTLKAGWQKRADSFWFLCLDSSLFFSLGQFSLLFAAFWS